VRSRRASALTVTIGQPSAQAIPWESRLATNARAKNHQKKCEPERLLRPKNSKAKKPVSSKAALPLKTSHQAKSASRRIPPKTTRRMRNSKVKIQQAKNLLPKNPARNSLVKSLPARNLPGLIHRREARTAPEPPARVPSFLAAASSADRCRRRPRHAAADSPERRHAARRAHRRCVPESVRTAA
jgi:hypothetical protein